MSSTYEIEIKSLLGEKKEAERVKNLILVKGGILSANNKQLNHYFLLNDVSLFKKNLLSYIKDDQRSLFENITTNGKNFSVRTREIFLPNQPKNKVILVIKASVDDNTSSNGVSRMEFEQQVDMTLEELDAILISSKLEYQSKWSREREEYKVDNITVCLDRNAGYGYLAEFEMITEDKDKIPEIKTRLTSIMDDFGVVELQQDRLERMFAYYNANWQDYYGTDNVFNIK